MTAPLLHLFIDGKKTNLLKPIVAKPNKAQTAAGLPGNTYFAPSPQAVRFGIRVGADVLSKGLATVFSVGTTAENAVEIPLSYGANKNERKMSGSVGIEFAGRDMTASVTVNALRPGVFNLTPKVTNQATAVIYDAADVFA